MRRRKGHITGLVALGLAVVVAIPAMAQAEPSPYVLQSETRQPMELGLSEGKIRALGLLEQTTPKVDPTPVVNDRSINVNAYTVTGFGIALLFAIAVGMGLVAALHRRGTRLSPA